MSFTPTFFDFFDAINDQVQTFGRVLDDSRFADNSPRPKQNKAGPQQSDDNKTQQADDNNRRSGEGPGVVVPAVDLLECEKNYELNVAIPGIKDRKYINLEYHKEANQIVISGEIPSTIAEGNNHNVRIKELPAGKFKRVITVPKAPGVDANNIKADYTNGILRLNLPKLEPVQQGEVKKIAISFD